MRLLLALVAFTAVSIPAVEGYAQAEGEERDRTTERVERAEADYEQAVDFARGELIEALNEAVYRAADQGDLEELETLEAQRTAFEEKGELPASREVRREALAYHRAVERAADDLGNVYERAIRDYTRERRIEMARGIQAKHTLLREGITLDTVVYGQNRYALIRLAKNWHEARDLCAALGGHLVTVADADENAFIQRLIPPGEGCWLGATDEEEEGVWRWVDGSPVVYADWQRGEPNNGRRRRSQHYLWVSGGAQWDDIGLAENAIPLFICEWEAGVEEDTTD